MPSSVEELVDLLDLEVIEDNLFRGRQPATRLQRVFGGQVLAQSLVAAVRTVPERVHRATRCTPTSCVPATRRCRSSTTSRRSVTAVRFATRRVAARQHGRPIFFLTANFQRPEVGLEHQDPMPDVAGARGLPETGGGEPGSGRDTDEWQREWAALEVRYAGRLTRGRRDRGPPRRRRTSRLWIRVNGELPDDRALADGGVHLRQRHDPARGRRWCRTVSTSTLRGMQAASLDHTIWFHRPFRADEWWLYDQVTPSASGGAGSRSPGSSPGTGRWSRRWRRRV